MSPFIFVCFATALLCRSAQGQFDDTNFYVSPLQGPQSQGVECRNPHGLTGMCVAVERCGHSTDHIDLRLYRPRNYVGPCISPQICCPTASISIPQDRGPNFRRYDDFD